MDTALLVGDWRAVPSASLDAIASLPKVIVGPSASEAPGTTHVSIDTGRAGIHEGGTAYRLDDIPLPLSAAARRPPHGSHGARRARGSGGSRPSRGGGMTTGATLRIAGGAVYDPANGIDGEVRDICIADGRIVADLPAGAPIARCARHGRHARRRGHPQPCRELELQSRAPSPARSSTPPTPCPRRAWRDGHTGRSGTGGTVPSTFTTGYRYAGLGYTTVFDAAIAPLTARHTHHEMSDTPCIDAGCFVLMGNDDYLLKLIDAGERDRARDYAAWLLGATGGYAIKVVNPGGVEAWKTPQRNLTGARRAARQLARHGARHPRDAHRRGEHAQAAARRAHPREQPRHAGQRRHHAGELPGARGTTGALHPPAVSRLRHAAAGGSRRRASSPTG